MDFKDLTVYMKSFKLAMEIFQISKTFPKDEIYSLTSQIRRSSRAVCSAVAEAYRKRQYKDYFVNKISDADMENSETQVWLDFALSCNYITETEKEKLENSSSEIGKLLNHMLHNPEKYLSKNVIKK